MARSESLIARSESRGALTQRSVTRDSPARVLVDGVEAAVVRVAGDELNGGGGQSGADRSVDGCDVWVLQVHVREDHDGGDVGGEAGLGG